MSASLPAFALRVSPPGAGAIHLVWVGGDGAEAILRKIAPGRSPQGVQLGKWTAGQETIDEAMWRPLLPQERPFPGPAFEISLHGSEAILRKALQALESLGARVCSVEEFLAITQEGGNCPLWRAEAWRAFLEARSPAGARLFLAQIHGALAEEIRDLLASPAAPPSLVARLEALLERGRAAAALRNPRRIALVGRPNAGKSTLFNALVGYERAIVSPQEGTTRDLVEEIVQLGGYPFHAIDTAGLRASEDPIEREGAQLSIEAARRADLAVFVWDARREWSLAEQEALASLGEAKILRFPFRMDSLAQAIARLEAMLLAALDLPNPAPQSGPAPVSPAQIAALDRAVKWLREGRDARPELQSLLA